MSETAYTPLSKLVVEKGLQTGPFGSQLKAEEYSKEGIPVVMPKDILAGKIITNDIARIPLEKVQDVKKHALQKGDVLFPRRGVLGRIAVARDENAGWICGTGCLRARLKKDISVDFVHQYVLLPQVEVWLNSNAVGQTMLNLNTEIIGELPIFLPPLAEQKKIAEVLGTWDEAIENVEKQITGAKAQKKALMQQLLSARTRFPHFTDDWQTVKLGDVLEIKTGREDANIADELGEYPFYTCAKNPTRCNQFSFDTEALLIAGNGDIGTTHYFNGKFEAYQRTYVLFNFEKSLDVQYLKQYTGVYLPRSIEKERQHGAMPYIKVGLLQNFNLPLPSSDEQKAIAQVLDVADAEITNLQAQLEKLKTQKKGLMQQLLTGKTRVKVDKEAA